MHFPSADIFLSLFYLVGFRLEKYLLLLNFSKIKPILLPNMHISALFHSVNTKVLEENENCHHDDVQNHPKIVTLNMKNFIILWC